MCTCITTPPYHTHTNNTHTAVLGAKNTQPQKRTDAANSSYLPREVLEHHRDESSNHAQTQVERKLYQRRHQVVRGGPQRQLVVKANLGHQGRHNGAQKGSRDERLAVVVSVKRVLKKKGNRETMKSTAGKRACNGEGKPRSGGAGCVSVRAVARDWVRVRVS